MIKLLKRKETKKEILPVEDNCLDRNSLGITDLFSCDGIENNFDYIRLGADKFSRVYVVHALPRMLQIGWLDEIFFRAGDVDVSMYITPAPDRQVINNLIRKETQVRAQKALDWKSGNISRLPELDAAIADYSILREQVQLSRDRLYYVCIYMAVHASTFEELRHKCSSLEDVFARKNVLVRTLVLRQKEGIVSILPISNNRVDDYWKNLTTGAAACCLPASTVAVGHSSGIPLAYSLSTRAPILLNRFAGEHIVSNHNMFICGESGSGKSVTGRVISLRESTFMGVKHAFVDPEGEYVRLTQETGGQVCKIVPGSFSGMNILDIEPGVEEDELGNKREVVNIQDKVAEFQALIATVVRHNSGRSLEPKEVAVLEECLLDEYIEREINTDPTSLYEGGVKKNMPTITSLHTRIGKKSEVLADVLRPMLKNGSMGMFDGQTTLKLSDTPMICFSLKAVQVDFTKFFATYVVLGWVWQQFAQKGGKAVPKSVDVDEAWMFMKYDEAANHLETLARRGRKHGCGLVILTQRFEEFSMSLAGRSVIESCATVLTLKQEEHAASAAVDYFKLSGGCRDLLVQATPGVGILRLSGAVTGIEVAPASFEWPYVETKLVY